MTILLKEKISKLFINKLIKLIEVHDNKFSSKEFIKEITEIKNFEKEELLSRINIIAESLNKHLNGSFLEKIRILENIAAQFTGIEGLLFPHFVSLFGTDNIDLSIQVLEKFTVYSTSEFAVRKLYLIEPKKILAQALKWAESTNPHHRRLASEALRPKLPWAIKLQDISDNPEITYPILEKLLLDDEIYVRKSVANHLNDFSKDHPKFVLEKAEQFIGKDPKYNWIFKHALRTLLKAGNKEALSLFQYDTLKGVELLNFNLSPKHIKVGDNLSFHFDVFNHSKKEYKVRVEYVIYYRQKEIDNSAKIYKISEKKIPPESKNFFYKKHSFKIKSTRIYYSGEHKIEIRLNGEKFHTEKFFLKD